MATNIKLGGFTSVYFEADVDDSLNIISFRCVNDSGATAFGLLKRLGADGQPDGTQYGGECPPGVTVFPVPTGANGRIRVAPHPSKPGRYTGYDADCREVF